MYCKACGKQIDVDSAFCRYCGKPQGGSSSSVASEVRAAPPRWETCEIEAYILEQGGTFSLQTFQFVARAIGPKGSYNAAVSSKIQQYYSVTRPRHEQNEGTIRTYELLVAELVGAGWEATGRSGIHWFSQSFRRMVTEAAAPPSTINVMQLVEKYGSSTATTTPIPQTSPTPKHLQQMLEEAGGPWEVSEILWHSISTGIFKTELEFIAQANGPQGQNVVAYSSRVGYKLTNIGKGIMIPSMTEQSKQAHSVLVQELLNTGWEEHSRGEHWFNIRFRRKVK